MQYDSTTETNISSLEFNKVWSIDKKHLETEANVLQDLECIQEALKSLGSIETYEEFSEVFEDIEENHKIMESVSLQN